MGEIPSRLFQSPLWGGLWCEIENVDQFLWTNRVYHLFASALQFLSTRPLVTTFFCASLIYTALLLYFSFFIIFFRVCSCKIFTCCMAKAVLDYQHDKFPGETFALYFFNCLFLFSRSVELFVVSVIIIIFSIVKQWQVIFTQKRHIISYFEPQLLGVVNFIFKKEKWWFCLYCIFKILIIDSN